MPDSDSAHLGTPMHRVSFETNTLKFRYQICPKKLFVFSKLNFKKPLPNWESPPLNTLTHRLLFNTKHFEVLGPYLPQRDIFGMTFKRKMANAESAPLKKFIWRVSFTTKYFAFYGYLLQRKGTLVMEFEETIVEFTIKTFE